MRLNIVQKNVAVQGCLVVLKYGFIFLYPSGKSSLASSSDTLGTIITSSPLFQFAGVATLWDEVSWIESKTRKISLKFLPVVIG